MSVSVMLIVGLFHGPFSAENQIAPTPKFQL